MGIHFQPITLLFRQTFISNRAYNSSTIATQPSYRIISKTKTYYQFMLSIHVIIGQHSSQCYQCILLCILTNLGISQVPYLYLCTSIHWYVANINGLLSFIEITFLIMYQPLLFQQTLEPWGVGFSSS